MSTNDLQSSSAQGIAVETSDEQRESTAGQTMTVQGSDERESTVAAGDAGQRASMQTSDQRESYAGPRMTPAGSDGGGGARSDKSVSVSSSQRIKGASEHSMQEQDEDEEKGEEKEEDEEDEEREEGSQHSTVSAVFELGKGEPSLESISHPYNTKDKDFVNAKAFLLQASTLTGLNL